MNLEFIKQHPWETGIAIVVIGGGLLYLLTRGGSSTASSSTSANGTPLAVLQLQAAQDAQNAQLNAQVQTQQLQAGVANNQINAQLTAVQDQTAAQIQAIQLQTQAAIEGKASDNATQIALATISAQATTQQQANAETASYNLQKLNSDVLTTQLATQATVLEDQINAGVTEHVSDNQTALGAIETQYSYQNAVAQLQAQLASQQSSQQFQLSNTTLGIVSKTGLNHEGSKQTGILETIAAALNQPAIGVGAANAQAVANGQPSAFSQFLGAAAGSFLRIAPSLLG